jgi:hypothetical protein
MRLLHQRTMGSPATPRSHGVVLRRLHEATGWFSGDSPATPRSHRVVLRRPSATGDEILRKTLCQIRSWVWFSFFVFYKSVDARWTILIKRILRSATRGIGEFDPPGDAQHGPKIYPRSASHGVRCYNGLSCAFSFVVDRVGEIWFWRSACSHVFHILWFCLGRRH